MKFAMLFLRSTPSDLLRRISNARFARELVLIFLGAAAILCAGSKLLFARNAPTSTSQQQVLATFGKLPLRFEANRGQTDPRVKFLSRGSGYSLFLTSTEAVLKLQKSGVRSHRSTTLTALSLFEGGVRIQEEPADFCAWKKQIPRVRSE